MRSEKRPAAGDGGSARDGIGRYLDSIRDFPILDSDRVADLAETLAREEQAFRDALRAVPGAALRIVERWRERQAEGRVTGTLCQRYRENPSHDWSTPLDACLGELEGLVQRWSRAVERRGAAARGQRRGIETRMARVLDEAEIHLDVLCDVHEELSRVAAASRSRAATASRRRLGIDRAAQSRLAAAAGFATPRALHRPAGRVQGGGHPAPGARAGARRSSGAGRAEPLSG